ncbi:unnamed protein product, partial [Mycena citricolor]
SLAVTRATNEWLQIEGLISVRTNFLTCAKGLTVLDPLLCLLVCGRLSCRQDVREPFMVQQYCTITTKCSGHRSQWCLS